MSWNAVVWVVLFGTISCGGRESHSQPPFNDGPQPGQVDVAGRVVDTFSWAVEGATVYVTGQGPVATDNRGGFEFHNVSTPYSLTVLDHASADRARVLVHAGFSRNISSARLLTRR